MVVGLLEGVGGAGWRGAKGGNEDNCNSIINDIILKRNHTVGDVLCLTSYT